MPDTLTDAQIAQAAPQTLTDADIAKADQQPSYLDSVKKNLIPSLVHFLQSSAPGPTSGDLPTPGRKPNEDAQTYWKRMEQTDAAGTGEGHPLIDAAIQSVKDLAHKVANPKEFFEQDPVGAVQTYGNILRGGVDAAASIPGVSEAARTAGTVAKAAAQAGGKDIAAGAGKVAAGAAIPVAAAYLPGGEAVKVGAEMAGLPVGGKLVVQGGKQIVAGSKAAIQAGRDALTAKLNAAIDRVQGAYDPATAPKTDLQLAAPVNPEPSASAGPQPMQVPSAIPPVARAPRGPIPISPRQTIMAPGSSGAALAPVEQTGPVTIPFSEPETSSAVFQAQARAEKASKLAQFLHDGGITAEEAKGMTGDHWQMAAKGAGVNAPSLASQGQAVFELRRLEAASHSPQLMNRLQSTGSMSVAQQLADSMTK
jgi:hypothetical protein